MIITRSIPIKDEYKNDLNKIKSTNNKHKQSNNQPNDQQNNQSNKSFQIDGFIKTDGKYEMECFLKSQYNQGNLEFGKFHSNNSIILKYIDESQYDCVLCQRKHVNNTNRSIVYKFSDGDIYFQCRV